MRRETFEERQALRSLLKGMLMVPVLGILFMILVGGVIALLQFTISYMPFAGILPVVAVFGIGIVQLIYLVPLGLYFQRQGRHEWVKGLAIGGLLVALLNGACFGGVFLIRAADYGLTSLAVTLLVGLVLYIGTLVVLLINRK
jgi:FtsH-binding integral membrane protein